jgi:hypothetical protein
MNVMMKRFAILFVLLLSACSLGNETLPTVVPVVATAVPFVTATSPPPLPTNTATAVPPTQMSLPTITSIPQDDLGIRSGDIRLYPVSQIYSGDLVTFQLLPFVPAEIAPENVSVHVLVDDRIVVSGVLDGRNLGGSTEALYKWAWDTTDASGLHQVKVILDRDDSIVAGDTNPDNNLASLTVNVQPETARPRTEANAEWLTAQSACCLIHAISGTAAGRDLSHLLTAVETAVQQASLKLNEPLQSQIEIYFVDKVIGQGGYASGYMVISYLDRHYAGNGLHHVLVHEATHVLDRQFAPQRIIFLTEGLAVWASDGHFKTDDLNQRAAAVVATGNYVPLAELVNDFYNAQHESSYVQAAGFITYLIETYGWPSFRAFYSDVTADDASTLAEALNLNLQAYYGKSLDQMEADWLAYLESLPPDRTQVTDLLTTIRYYDVMRRYQTVYDPTAHFLTAWLPSPPEVQEQGNTADLTRHPHTDTHVALETMLQSADTAVRAGDYNLANVLLDSVTRVLDNEGTFIDPMAVNYLNIVHSARALGFEAQKITLTGTRAQVMATAVNKTRLTRLDFTLSGGDWVLTN